MALYILAKGGIAPEYGNSCKGCSVDTDNELPVFLQPDSRDGYHFRDKITWEDLLHELDRRYDKDATDLEVGDKLRIFLQPNHANVKSIFMDFREPVAGFKFNLVAANGADYSGKIYQSTYTKCGGVDNQEEVEEVDTAAVDAFTQITTIVENGYNSKVDAIDLEIVALPQDPSLLQKAQIQFARRFEPEGYMMPSFY
ncbi:hypothetical protein [Avibacterium endocarditidis]|uniref:Uncharacterized protein n=1 Tax=Avibacterium endocarditidis TaxID=380674 RepID=A0ABX4ZRZ7_9PAST|nr:hypothetical protein [Avibacterium endocarditidis]POY42247.1 hypothetical protein C3Z13_06955 [Avibacterium endocarditidis]